MFSGMEEDKYLVRRKKTPLFGDLNLGTSPLKLPKTSFPSLLPTQTPKDTRRSFTETQKNEILHQQDGKCARCHKRLDPRAKHFHHAKPWASGGRTKTANGKAVCPTCHKILTHQEQVKQADSTRKTKDSNPFSNLI